MHKYSKNVINCISINNIENLKYFNRTKWKGEGEPINNLSNFIKINNLPNFILKSFACNETFSFIVENLTFSCNLHIKLSCHLDSALKMANCYQLLFTQKCIHVSTLAKQFMKTNDLKIGNSLLFVSVI